MLAMYVNPGFLYGRLHHEGGIVFFLIALAGLMFLLWILQRLGNKPVPQSVGSPALSTADPTK
jgi:lipoprotein signal peptidase